MGVDPIREREDNLEVMLAGQWEGVSREEAQQAISDAETSRTGEPFARTLGFGVISSTQRGDGVDYLVAVSDGNRHAAVTARLSGTRVATLGHEAADPAAYIVERLQELTGTLPNDGNRYENVVAQDQPISIG